MSYRVYKRKKADHAWTAIRCVVGYIMYAVWDVGSAVPSSRFRLKPAGLFLFAAPKRKQKGAFLCTTAWALPLRVTRCIRTSSVTRICFANHVDVPALQFELCADLRIVYEALGTPAAERHGAYAPLWSL